MTPLGLPRARGARRTARGEAGLRLYGVVSLAAPGALAVDGAAASARARLHTPPLGTPAAEVLRVRDLGAVVSPAHFAAESLTDDLVRGYRAVVEAVFAERAVLPAPPGTLFRSRAALTAWMELHAGSLAEGLRFAEDRAEARVTAEGAGGEPGAADRVAWATEAFAALRREAVALLVLRAGANPGEAGVAGPGGPYAREGPIVPTGAVAGGHGPGGHGLGGHVPRSALGASVEAAHAAFLVDRSRWGAFADAVAREGRRHPALRLVCEGPWPPYSFVRLDFHG